MFIFEECLLQSSRRWVRLLTKWWELSPYANLALAGFGTWLSLLVLYSVPTGFSMGTVVFPSHQNPNLLLDIHGPKPKRQGSVLIPENAILTVYAGRNVSSVPLSWRIPTQFFCRVNGPLLGICYHVFCGLKMHLPIHRTNHACCDNRYCKTTRGFR